MVGISKCQVQGEIKKIKGKKKKKNTEMQQIEQTKVSRRGKKEFYA